MAVTGVSAQEYQDFFTNGGNVTYNIESNDISDNADFENFETIKPNLKTGFELPPSSVIHSLESQVEIIRYGTEWTKIVARVYRNDGKIIYKKLDNGSFQADCSIRSK